MSNSSRLVLLIAAALALPGCGADSPTTPLAAPVANVTVAAPPAAVAIGATVQLTATLKDAQGTTLTGRTITWSSAQPAIATVNPTTGLATAVAAGSATITATSEGIAGSTTLTVSPPAAAVATVTVTAGAQPMERTTTQTLAAVTRDASNNVLTGRTVTWSSSAPAVASVDAATGVVTALDRGRATITATSENRTGTAAVEVIVLYRSVTAGGFFTCDLGSIGVATCWGTNGGQDGLLGNGPLDNASLPGSTVPVNVLGGHRFTQISSGARHSCGITAAGAAYCWGSNGDGQLGAPSMPSWAHQPVPVSGGLAFASISAGGDHSCGITTTGAAWCWGDNDEGQLGTGNVTDSNVPVAVAGGIAFASISAGLTTGGNSKTCAVATDGRGFCWGSDVNGEIGDGGPISGQTTDIKPSPTLVSSGTGFSSISVGTQHVCGILVTGVAVCWGNGNSGVLGNGANGVSHSAPVAVSGSQTFRQLETGYTNTCGVTSTFTLMCWGANVNGESGGAVQVGQIAETPAIAAAGEWAEVSLGTTSQHTCAVTRDRLSVRCMGRNDVGQLGNGTTTGVNTANAAPVLVSSQQPLP